MAFRAVSPVLIGRGGELTALDAALSRASSGLGTGVLVAGEAGIGKSRLVREFVERAAGRVLLGGCLELGAEGLAFAAFTSALRPLVRGQPELVSGQRELSRLFPELGPAPGDSADEAARGRLFEAVLGVLDRLGETRPVVLVIEDLHWADRSSRELFAFLLRNIGQSRVLLVGTYRSDELHRRHPLRALLAELDRSGGLARIEVPQLSRREVAEQARVVLGEEPDPAVVNTVYRRSEGNPLFVETLLACPDQGRCGIDESLRDLLLRVVEGLPEESRGIVRLAAVCGERAGHRLLGAVSGHDEETLAAAVRPAVEANVLVPDEDCYAFRHALLREAVHDSLLPGEQVRGHVGCAEAIEAEPGLVPAGRFAAEVAYHWYRAHRPGEALAAAWRAAEAAESARAYAEQMAMLARVLEFWEAVPEAADTVGADHTAVLEGAVGAALHSGEYERGVAFASAALGELDTGREPLRAAILLQQRGTLARNLGRPGGSADLRAAARLTEAYPNSTVRARVLGRHAQLLMTFEGDDPVPLATEALRIARRAGDGYGEAHALNTLACVWFNRGEVEAAFSAYARSQELARQTGSTMLLARAATNLSDALEGTGDYQRAIEVASRGRQEAAAAGIVRTQGAFLALNVIGPLVALGRWDEAMEILEHAIGLDPPPTYRAFMALWRAEVALPRGDLEAAGEHLRRARAVAGDTLDETQVWLPLVRLEAEVAAAGGEHETALAMLTDTLERAETSRFPRYVWPLLSTGARLVADTGTHTNLLAAIQRLAAELTIFGTVQPAHRALAEAETARAQGRNEPRLWDAALQAWQAAGEPYRISYTAYRAGEAAIAAGQRTKARAPLRRAATIAADLHAQPLGKRIDELAHRARVPLADDHADAPAPATGTPFGLTARETDVLQLLAAGHSNGQIASALFISPKTASVHVSNILAKLKVETRGAAAAMARDRALV